MAQRGSNTWRVVQWGVLGGLAAIGFVLGFIGYLQYDPKAQPWTTGFWAIPDAAYRTLQLVRLSGTPAPPLPVPLEIARFLLPFVATYSVLVALFIVFWDRAQQLRLPFWSGHTVVVGLGDKGTAFMKTLREDKQRVVAIESNPNSPGLAVARAHRVPIVDGDGRDEAVLRTAGIQRARAIAVVTDSDSVNAEVAVTAREIARQRTRHRISFGRRRPPTTSTAPLKCLAHIDDPDLGALLEADEMRAQPSEFLLDYFTVDAHAARILTARFVMASGGAMPIVMIGTSRLIEQLLESIRREQLVDHSAGADVHLVALDGGDEAAVDRLVHRLANVQVSRLSSESIARWTNTMCPTGGVVFVDHEDDAKTLETALALRRVAADRATTIVACMRVSPGLERAVSRVTQSGFSSVCAYSVIAETCTPELLDRGWHEEHARRIHERYVATSGRPSDDPSMRAWEDLDERIRDSNRAQAHDVVKKLRMVDCDIVAISPGDEEPFEFTSQEITFLAQLEHERWCAEHRRDNWTYGPRHSDTEKTHPDLVPFDELPATEVEKNRIAVRDIPLLLGRAGFYVVRIPSTKERVHETADIRIALQRLGLARPRPVVAVIGGAANFTAANEVAPTIADGLLPLCDALGAALVDGGTDAGVMQLLGRVRARQHSTSPLIGVAAIGTINGPDAVVDQPAELERNHTHFVLTPGSSWGAESPWIPRVARALAGKNPVVGLLIGGGAISHVDVTNMTDAEIPVLVVAGSGGLADAIAVPTPGEAPSVTELREHDLVTVVDAIRDPSRFVVALRSLLEAQDPPPG